MPLPEILEGGTSKVHVDREAGRVEKRLKRKGTQRLANLDTEQAFHQEIQALVLEVPTLMIRVPRLLETGSKYVMELVDTSRPLWEEDVWGKIADPDTVRDRVLAFLKHVGGRGIVLQDVEAYLQADGSIVLLDFGQVHRGSYSGTLSSASLLPPSVTEFASMW
jgi:RIO-like serine/threonine protein kinase